MKIPNEEGCVAAAANTAETAMVLEVEGQQRRVAEKRAGLLSKLSEQVRYFTSGTPIETSRFQPTSRTEKPTRHKTCIQTFRREWFVGGFACTTPLTPDFVLTAAPLTLLSQWQILLQSAGE